MPASTPPLIEPEDKQPDEQINIRLRPELAMDLRAYGEYANSSVHHVVSAALKRLFIADKGFKTFKDGNPQAGSASTNGSASKNRGSSRPKLEEP